ncbi:MAG: hypothetical protein D6732_01190 [Methanobacteriota archaeon]|nr:MAG: hypothetical protein D6732_01190 [Euryarchaeota archaeon]
MGYVLTFENGKPLDIHELIDVRDFDYSNLQWISYVRTETIVEKLPEFIQKSRRFTEDLLEDQRPRFQDYSSLAPGKDRFKVAIFKFITRSIFETDEFELQLSILLTEETIITITNKETPVLLDIMSKIRLRNESMNRNRILSLILDELVEEGIEIIERLENELELMEKRQLSWDFDPNWLPRLTDLKGRVYTANRSVRADVEVIRDMQKDIELRNTSFEHTEDRLLFLLDLLDFQRDNMNNIVNLHLTLSSQKRAEAMDRLTIIGSLLVIPTVIAGLFGMNVPLPPLDFYDILWLTLALMVVTAFGIRLILPKV